MDHPTNRQRPLVAVLDLVTSVGGVQSVMAAVLPRLTDEFDIMVIDAYNHPEYAAMMHNAGLTMSTLGYAPQRRYIGGTTAWRRACHVTGRLPWLFLTMLRLRRWILHHKPAVLYFNQLPAARVFSKTVSRWGPKLVFHAHGFRGTQSIGSKTGRLLARRFARVLAVSKITADFLVEAGANPQSVKIVYNGVDADRLQRDAAAAGLPLPTRTPEDVVFVHAAVLNRLKKAQHVAIDALARLPRDLRSQLWICGDVASGDDRSYVGFLRDCVASLGLEKRVHFLGWRTDVPRVIGHSDVCILPSLDHSESFGMVLAEAMALGKPCIGSNRGGIPEVIEHEVSGIVCPPTAEELASAMTRLARSPDLRDSMGQAGRQRVTDLFSLSRQAAQITEHLHAILDEERNQP